MSKNTLKMGTTGGEAMDPDLCVSVIIISLDFLLPRIDNTESNRCPLTVALLEARYV